MSNTDAVPQRSPIVGDPDPAETGEWLESLDYVLESKGPERVKQLLTVLDETAYRNGVELPFTATTPYINTIPRDKQPAYPGNRELERRIKSFVRWNAMAMVTFEPIKRFDAALGGHISTFASSRRRFTKSHQNHFFRGRGEMRLSMATKIYFQGHAVSWACTPELSWRADLREENLENFRRELGEPEPRPFVLPTPVVDAQDFWEFPTVSMGLAPIMAIYQARFNRIPRRSRDPSTLRTSTSLGLPGRWRM